MEDGIPIGKFAKIPNSLLCKGRPFPNGTLWEMSCSPTIRPWVGKAPMKYADSNTPVQDTSRIKYARESCTTIKSKIWYLNAGSLPINCLISGYLAGIKRE